MSTYRSSPKGLPLHQGNSLDNPANDSESPKAPSTIFNLNYTVLYTTLRTPLYSSNSTQLNSTQPQLSTPIIQYSVPVCDKVDALTAQLVQPQGFTSRRLADDTRTKIHLEIEEVLEEKKIILYNLQSNTFQFNILFLHHSQKFYNPKICIGCVFSRG